MRHCRLKLILLASNCQDMYANELSVCLMIWVEMSTSWGRPTILRQRGHAHQHDGGGVNSEGQIMTEKLEALYEDNDYVNKMAELIAPRVERFVHHLLGIAPYEYSDGRYPGFSSDIISCHYPLRDKDIEHINRVVVGHLMLHCNQLVYFSSRLNPTLSKEERASYDKNLQFLGKLFRGEEKLLDQPAPLKPQLVFALAILHDVGKTAFLEDGGHEERAGKLVEKVLRHICKKEDYDERNTLGLDDTDIPLGRALIENHTMLGTLVQGERSAFEVFEWLKRNSTHISQEMFLSYLLLLNSMDVSGYRYMPIILDHYWIKKYKEFSEISVVRDHANNPIAFAKYRLRELARNNVADFGDIKEDEVKQAFHKDSLEAFEKLLDEATQRKIGYMWIRDALYFIFDLNECGNGGKYWPTEYARIYVSFFEALAQIAIKGSADIVAFRKGNNTVKDHRTANPERIQKLVEKLKNYVVECKPNDGHKIRLKKLEEKGVVAEDSFQEEGATVEFTINEEGQLADPPKVV